MEVPKNVSNDLVDKIRETVENYENQVVKIGGDFDICVKPNSDYDACLEIFKRIGVRNIEALYLSFQLMKAIHFFQIVYENLSKEINDLEVYAKNQVVDKSFLKVLGLKFVKEVGKLAIKTISEFLLGKIGVYMILL